MESWYRPYNNRMNTWICLYSFSWNNKSLRQSIAWPWLCVGSKWSAVFVLFLCHHLHESTKHIRYAKWHHQLYIQYIFRLDSCLLFVCCLCLNMVLLLQRSIKIQEPISMSNISSNRGIGRQCYTVILFLVKLLVHIFHVPSFEGVNKVVLHMG